MWRTSSQLVTQAVSTQTHQIARNSIARLDEAERIGMHDERVRDLGDREDEDQIEEQLDEADPLLGVAVAAVSAGCASSDAGLPAGQKAPRPKRKAAPVAGRGLPIVSLRQISSCRLAVALVDLLVALLLVVPAVLVLAALLLALLLSCWPCSLSNWPKAGFSPCSVDLIALVLIFVELAHDTIPSQDGVGGTAPPLARKDNQDQGLAVPAERAARRSNQSGERTGRVGVAALAHPSGEISEPARSRPRASSPAP